MHKYQMKQYLFIILGNFLFTLAYAVINVPKGIVNGGLTSLGMVVHRMTDLPVWLVVDAGILILLIACLVFLGKTYFYHSIISAICYVIFFTPFNTWLPELEVAFPIAVAISAIAVGVGCFLCICAKASTLGFDVVAMIVHKKNPKMGIAQTMFLCNAVVVLMGWMTYGFLSIVAGISGSALQAFTLKQLLKKWPQELTDE